ncbi:HEPN domain-containing protein [Nitratireductor aquibiodomus]|uniref:HEPN domain-containing protein n=1 Tax=Nitratireductor aquibiodomus TaxID=204799 RepID=UPI00046AF590|nr:HEPN domain-containing protein [Nitratireductor aquibiodomus]
MRHAIASRERKLDAFFHRAKKKVADDEVVSDLSKLAAVLACGYVERCVEVVILERLSNRAHTRVLKFIKAHFKRGTNYDCEAMCQLLDRFDTDWSKKLRQKLDANEQLATSLASLYVIRNSVAHGGDQNRGLAGIESMYSDCKLIIAALVEATQQ